MASPVFTKDQSFNNKQQLRVQVGDQGQGLMTVENTTQKAAGLFGILLVAAAIGWFFMPPAFLIPVVLIGFVLGLVNVFKKEISVPLIVAYAAFEGLVIGAISGIFETTYPGIVAQAVIATLCVLGVVLALFANGKIRESAKATKIFLVATLGYVLFSLVNFALMATGAIDGMYGVRGMEIGNTGIPIGVPLGIFAILLASYSLVMDFTYIQQGERNQLPEKYGWRGAFGLMVTIVWLYLEVLRLIGLMRE